MKSLTLILTILLQSSFDWNRVFQKGFGGLILGGIMGIIVALYKIITMLNRKGK